MNTPRGRSGTGLTAGFDVLLTVLVVTGLVVFLASRFAGGGLSPSGAESTVSPSTSPSSAPASYVVDIQPGLQVKWNAAAAAQETLDQIQTSQRLVGKALAEPRILSVSAWAGRDVPAEFGSGQMDVWPIVWVVEARGTFVTYTCPVTPCPSDSSGWYLFDDTGAVIGSGFPLPQPS
jgi:hypothetical protein